MRISSKMITNLNNNRLMGFWHKEIFYDICKNIILKFFSESFIAELLAGVYSLLLTMLLYVEL